MSAIDEIKQKLDIVAFISEYVPLQKAGRSFRAPCPFHNERTPSFFVFPERQTWRCFGACSIGGDIFAFLMKREGIEFGEALRSLAQRSGVALPSPTAPSKADHQRLYAAVEQAARYFHDLLAKAPEAEVARQFVQRRGISPASVQEFLIGSSPSGWTGLRDHLLVKGFDPKVLIEAGLLVKREGEEGYDRFRQRLMIPIRDDKGRVSGFGARELDGSQPKYMNSPQSPIFDKGGMLYGLDAAKGAVKDKGAAVVVEGYIDVIIAHQFGFKNVMASMGTSLTERQAKALQSLASQVLLCLDPDAAGQEATLRGLESSWRIFDRVRLPATSAQGLALYQRQARPSLRVMKLPAGKDPDEVILENPDEWRACLEQALDVIDYLFDLASSRQDLSTAEGKWTTANSLFPIIMSLENAFQREEYVQRLARLLDIEPGTLKASLGSSATPRRQPRPRGQALLQRDLVRSQGDPLEEFCLSLLLNFPELRPTAAILALEHFLRAENREIFTKWYNEYKIELWKDSLEPFLAGHLDNLLKNKLPLLTPRQQELALLQSIYRLEDRRLRETEDGLGRMDGNGEREKALLLQISARRKQLDEDMQKIEREINAR